MTSPQAEASKSPGEGYAAACWFFLFAAFILGTLGVYRMLSYDESDKIVGGDAYNYAILATRGVGFICAGVLCAVAAAASAVMRVSAQLATRWTFQPMPAGEYTSAQSGPTTNMQPTIVTAAAVRESPQATRHILCWNCGKEYDVGLQKCPHCGKKIALSPIYRP